MKNTENRPTGFRSTYICRLKQCRPLPEILYLQKHIHSPHTENDIYILIDQTQTKLLEYLAFFFCTRRTILSCVCGFFFLNFFSKKKSILWKQYLKILQPLVAIKPQSLCDYNPQARGPVRTPGPLERCVLCPCSGSECSGLSWIFFGVRCSKSEFIGWP